MSSLSIIRYPYFRSRSWAMLVMVVGIVVLLGGCAGRTAIAPTSAPAIDLEPTSVRPGALVAVIGSEWQPNQVVSVDLVAQFEGDLIFDTLAIARTEDDENFVISFFFPDDERWWHADDIMVVARATSSDLEASARLTVTQPAVVSATQTVLLPIVAFNPQVAPSTQVVRVDARPSPTGQVVAELVNLRAGPSLAHPVLTVVDQGASFAVLGQSANSNWLRIRLNNGIEGWIARVYTDFTASVSVMKFESVLLPTPTPTPQSQVWRGEYYSNPTLAGSPALVRADQSVEFDWAYSAPSAVVPPDNFSVRWTRAVYFPAGAYRFNITVDDGVRLWIGSDLVIDVWDEQGQRTLSAERTFQTDDVRVIQIEYVEAIERAQINFWWERVSEFPEWRAAYFPNRTLDGAPVLVRNEPAIDFNWGSGTPSGDLPRDNFSARWTRSVAFDQDVYRFRAQMDDGMRLFIDGRLIIDEWRDGGLREVVVDYPLSQGFHAIRIDYYETSGDASARLWWEKAGSVVAYPDWKGEYWANSTLSGDPTLVRNDPVLNFNWGVYSPDAAIPADNFSVRWTRPVQFNSGTYRFHIDADDGMRLWIDDQLLVDEWRDGGVRGLATDYALTNGAHTMRVEFYERTGEALFNIWWEALDQQNTFPDWKAEYWPNQSLIGDPTVVRNDRAINFEWGVGAAAPNLPVDRFSARWTRAVNFEPGAYQFYARADDGIRVWVDDNRIIDRWQDSSGREVYQAEVRLDGNHNIKVEYYDQTGGALAEVWWRKLTDQPTATPTLPPEPTLSPTAVPPTSTPVEPVATETLAPTSTYTPEPTLEPTPTETPEPEVTATPEPQAAALQNPGAESVEVTGSGYSQSASVFVYMIMPDGNRAPESYATATADAAGQLYAAFTMPATWPDGASISGGPITLLIVTADGANELSVQFDYTPN